MSNPVFQTTATPLPPSESPGRSPVALGECGMAFVSHVYSGVSLAPLSNPVFQTTAMPHPPSATGLRPGLSEGCLDAIPIKRYVAKFRKAWNKSSGCGIIILVRRFIYEEKESLS
ncbi:MAG: hypothetical protein FWB75_09630 [Oscillospiraceae bacterium]|nr:hypothetical protein [Oscillospiraceae bacterium]